MSVYREITRRSDNTNGVIARARDDDYDGESELKEKCVRDYRGKAGK